MDPDDYLYYQDLESAGYTPDEVGRLNLGRMFKRAIRGGVRRPGRRALPSPARLAMIQPAMSPSPVPVTRGRVITPGNQRVRQLGFQALTLAPGASGQMQARVLKAIQAQRLILGASGGTLDEISVLNIRVGVDSQLAGTGGLPGAMFERDSTGSEVQWNPAQTGTDVTLDISNISAVNTIVVTAGIYGIGAD